MEIIGRVTFDAKVTTLKDERKVVNFSIAINDRYKSKGETKQVVTYVNCSYWLGEKVATALTKGSIVSLFGRIGLNAYTSEAGEAKASLTFHVNNLKIIAPAKAKEVRIIENEAVPEDDLPF